MIRSGRRQALSGSARRRGHAHQRERQPHIGEEEGRQAQEVLPHLHLSGGDRLSTGTRYLPSSRLLRVPPCERRVPDLPRTRRRH
jgi:hypothetical protein